MNRKIAAEVRVLANRVEKYAKRLKFACDAIANDEEMTPEREKELRRSFYSALGQIRRNLDDATLLGEQAKQK